MIKPECDPRLWHDFRHVLTISVDNRCIAPSWPLDSSAFFAEVKCMNGCGLSFASILKQYPLPELEKK